MKKRLGILLPAMMIGILLLSGCGNKKGAANFVKDYYAGWVDGSMTAEKSFDDISDKSKELLGLTKDEYVTNLNASMQEANLTYKSVSIVGQENMSEGVYRIRRTLKTDSVQGNGETDTSYEYVIKEDGKFKFLLYGAYEKEELSKLVPRPNQLNIAVLNSYTGVDGLVLDIEVDNLSANHYSIGYMGDGEIVVTTEQGDFPEKIDGSVLMLSGGTRKGEFSIKSAKGKVEKVTINNIYALGDNLAPIDPQNSFSLTVYEAN